VPFARTRPMRITIIDHHALFADSLALTLEGEGFIVSSVELADRDASLASVLAAGLRSAGRLVLLEQTLGRAGNGLRLIAPLTASGAAVVLLTESRDRLLWGEAVRQGAKDVLHKTCSLAQVISTARRVRDGLPLMTAEQRATLVLAALADREETQAIRTRLDRLTPCEREILGALMRGDQVRDIAKARVVVEATVRSQIKSILAKLEMSSQLAAVGSAHRVAWRPPPS
jgi:two-component system nitrate/nitrite response regulator NarL